MRAAFETRLRSEYGDPAPYGSRAALYRQISTETGLSVSTVRATIDGHRHVVWSTYHAVACSLGVDEKEAERQWTLSSK